MVTQRFIASKSASQEGVPDGVGVDPPGGALALSVAASIAALARRQVQVVRFRHDEAVLGAGLQPGDKLVVSVLSAPVVGMKRRALETASPSARGRTVSERLSPGERER